MPNEEKGTKAHVLATIEKLERENTELKEKVKELSAYVDAKKKMEEEKDPGWLD